MPGFADGTGLKQWVDADMQDAAVSFCLAGK